MCSVLVGLFRFNVLEVMLKTVCKTFNWILKIYEDMGIKKCVFKINCRNPISDLPDRIGMLYLFLFLPFEPTAGILHRSPFGRTGDLPDRIGMLYPFLFLPCEPTAGFEPATYSLRMSCSTS